MNWLKSACILILLTLTVGCEHLPLEGAGSANDILGFYLFNEGEEDTNKCTLDYYDYGTGVYTKDIFVGRNPGIMNELGDVGTDMAICGDSLYVVGNAWNYFTQTREIFITDARDRVTPGMVYCFSNDGKLKWSTYTGVIPSRIVFNKTPQLF